MTITEPVRIQSPKQRRKSENITDTKINHKGGAITPDARAPKGMKFSEALTGRSVSAKGSRSICAWSYTKSCTQTGPNGQNGKIYTGARGIKENMKKS